jgi:hypothetical protein
MQNKSILTPLGVVTGTIGLILSWDYFLIGGPMLVLAFMMLFGPKLAIMAGQKRARQIPQQHTVNVPEQNQREMMDLIASPVPPVPAKGEISMMVRVLRQANLDPRAAVLLGEGDKPLLSVQDVLAELLLQSQYRSLPTRDLVQDVVKIHELIFTKTDEACQAEQTVDGVCVWLVDRILKDFHTELGQPIPKSEPRSGPTPSRFEL